MVLPLLRSGPKNGAELMDAMEGLTQGWWRPSPGSIYPLLEELEKEKLVTKREDGRYELVPGSESEFLGPFGIVSTPRSPAQMLQECSAYLSYFEDLSRGDPKALQEHRAELAALAKRLGALSQ